MTDSPSRCWAAITLGALTLAACGDPRVVASFDAGATDAGLPGAALVTVPDPRLGVLILERGLPLPDSGVEGVDAGPADAGAPSDAGAPMDAGSPALLDAGTPAPVDAGIRPPMDAGLPDAGTFDAGTPDAGTPSDAGTAAHVDAGVIVTSSAGLIYSGDRTQSPIDSVLSLHLAAIAARGTGRGTVFSKIGDSISTNTSGPAGGQFLNCLRGRLEGTLPWEINVRLGAHSALAPTIDHFSRTVMGPDDSWTRVSLATSVGMTAGWAITGSPSPLEQELTAAMPRYAVVMYGSNDIVHFGAPPYPLADQVELYERDMRTITDRLMARGVIPLLTTMPPDASYLRFAPAFSGVVRAIAQGRQVPLIDYQRELLALGPPHGLSSDGTHPRCGGFNTCCLFDSTSLSLNGYNVRNLITLQALDRMRRVFELGQGNLDPQAPRLTGNGSAAAPFHIPQVPFGELRDLRSSPWQATGSLSCPGAPAVSGPQTIYRLVLTRPTALRALLLDGGSGAQRISLLSAPLLSSCVRSERRLLAAALAAGTWYFVVNSTNGGSEYNFSVTECVPGDPDC